MNWIERIIFRFKSRKEQEKYLRSEFCKYTENPFRTNMMNYMQRVKINDSITGWGMKTLEVEEIKKRLDNGMCWLDYPVLNEDGTEIEGITGKNFSSE